MIFEKLPKEIQCRICALTEDQEFQQRFRTDPELDRIDQLKKHEADRYKLVLALISGRLVIEGRSYRCPSPAAIAYLYSVKSPLVFGGGRSCMQDLDLFMWITQQPGSVDMLAEDVFLLSLDYCKKHGYDPLVLVDDIPEIIRLGFQPFRILPARQGDLDLGPEWLAMICSRAAQAAGVSAARIMRGSMTAAAYWFTEWVRSNSRQQLRPAIEENLLMMQDDRCCRLICEYLAEKGVITKQQIEEYVPLMVYRPDKK